MFDGENIMDIERLKCVIIGRALREEEKGEEKNLSILVVTKVEGENSRYQRAGVGFVQGRYISFREGDFEARII